MLVAAPSRDLLLTAMAAARAGGRHGVDVLGLVRVTVEVERADVASLRIVRALGMRPVAGDDPAASSGRFELRRTDRM